MKSQKALFKINNLGVSEAGTLVKLQEIILKDLIKLEKIIGYVNSDDIPDLLKLDIIKNIIKDEEGK